MRRYYSDPLLRTGASYESPDTARQRRRMARGELAAWLQARVPRLMASWIEEIRARAGSRAGELDRVTDTFVVEITRMLPSCSGRCGVRSARCGSAAASCSARWPCGGGSRRVR